MSTKINKKTDNNKSNSHTSFALSLEVGNTIITPSIEWDDSYYTGSLADDDTLSVIKLSTLLEDLGLGLDIEDKLSAILDVTIREFRFGWYAKKDTGWLHIRTEYLDVTLVSTKDSTNNLWHTALSIASTYEQDLAGIMPLVDPQSLPTMQLKNTSIIYASSGFDSTITIDNYLPEDLHGIFSTSINDGFSLAVKITLDDLMVPLVLPLKKSTALTGTKKKPLSGAEKNAQSDTSANTPSNTSANVGRSLGPVTVSGIGLTYQEGELVLGLDGALNLSNFQMYLLDMELKLNVNELMSGNPEGLSFDLSGLYLDLQTSGFSLNGGLLRNTIVHDAVSRDEYVGQLSLKTKAFSLTALGMYSQLINGDHSLFAYLALNTPIGGDPAFFVEGLALGFGYNRDVLVPPINEVNQFPLVIALGDDQPIGESGTGDSGEQALVRKRFDALSEYLPAKSGQYLVCAGLKFSTYKQIDSIAVLMIEFGQDLGIHLVGTSEMRLPMGMKHAVVAIEMAYRMSLDMAEGVISLEAQLTDNSYVLSRHCKLTGGFAFYSWFNGDNKGDFVVSMGGYHPAFNVPDYYPVVPRLGFRWAVSNDLSFKGEMYAALTPIAIMAGAGVSAYLDQGRLKAWFNADMNFIIYWQPFYYQAEFGVSVGAEYRMGWDLCSIKHRTEVSVHLNIHGPEFSGNADVHWIIFSFSFEFGDADKKSKDPLTWKQFNGEYIPSPDKRLVTTVTKGERERTEGYHLIDPDSFELKIDSIMPVNKINVNGTDVGQNSPLSLAPMGGKAVSDWSIDINILDEEKNKFDGFIIKPENKRYPKAIWGDDFEPDISAQETTIDRLSGLVITPRITQDPGFTEALGISDFDMSERHKKDVTLQWSNAIESAICRNSATNNDRITNTLSSPTVTEHRNDVAKFFQLGYTPTVDIMKNNLESAFIGTPLTR